MPAIAAMSHGRQSELPNDRRGRLLLQAVAIAAVTPLAVYFAATYYYGMAVSRAMFVVDFVAFAYLSALFFQFQRRPVLATVPFIVATSLLTWAAILKFQILGAWVRFGDLMLLDEALATLSLGQQAGVIAALASSCGTTLYNLRIPNGRRLAAALAPLLVLALLSAAMPGALVTFLRATTHAGYGNDPLFRSPLFAVGYDFLGGLQYQRQVREFLTEHPVTEVDRFAGKQIRQPRNVHMFVLESWMDPALLGLPLARDPIDRRIRSVLGGSSVSPVFAGSSAQAEFELLCGTPAYDLLDPVTFNNLGGEPIPCLPALLRRHGYQALASSDVSPNFFNARIAYRSLGFTRVWFRNDLPATDLDGTWVSATDRIAINKDAIQPLLDSGTPFLNYMFLTTGHIPYEMNPRLRPPVIETTSTPEVTRFVNAVYYNTRAVADYIELLKEHDPNSVIVVVGDHQGALPSIERSQSRKYSFDRYLTPYLVLDAGKPRINGDLAQYDLPHLVVACLTDTEFTPMAQSRGFELVRPLGDQAFYRDPGEGVAHCPNDSDPRCAQVAMFTDETIAVWLSLIERSNPGDPHPPPRDRTPRYKTLAPTVAALIEVSGARAPRRHSWRSEEVTVDSSWAGLGSWPLQSARSSAARGSARRHGRAPAMALASCNGW